MHIGVIGGGAAGMMAAIFAASGSDRVTILEHTQRVGKKILSTGNGKCNFTNKKLSKDDYYTNHPSFVENALSKFDETAAVCFFQKSGMEVISKRDGYYYPHTGQATTVLNTLRLRLAQKHVKIKTEEQITSVHRDSGSRYTDGKGFVVTTKSGKYYFDKVILACGGNAAPTTGSDGSGYSLARALGHSVIKPLPVLTSLYSSEKLLKEMAGVRAVAEISLWIDGETVGREKGELQLNKDNLSGIPVFQLSHQAIRALDHKKSVLFKVNFLPECSAFETEAKIRQIKSLYMEVPVSEALCCILHKKICGAILHKTDISFATKMTELSDKEICRMVKLIHDFSFTIIGHPGFEAAQATMGGVSINEIDENMMSRKVEGLYFAGEMIDVDGRCGGYNLQWAWTSGYIAGCHSSRGEVKCYK